MAEHNHFKMWFMKEGGMLEKVVTHPTNSESASSPRQLLPIAYWQNGYVDIVRSNTVLVQQSMTGDNVVGFKISEKVHELDYPEDIPLLEELLLAEISSLAPDNLEMGQSSVRPEAPIDRYPT